MSDRKMLAAAVGAALLLAGCGGDSKPTADAPAANTKPGTTAAATTNAAAAADVCSLLTTAELTAALGAPVGAGEAAVTPGPVRNRSCSWATDTTPTRTYTLQLTADADFDEALRKNGQTAKGLFDATKAGYTSGLVPVSGLGDEGYRFQPRVIARKGDVFVSALTFGDSAEAIAALETLTKSAVSKL